jgi:hypothetical protein
MRGSAQYATFVLTTLWSANNYVKVFLYPMFPTQQILFERSQSAPACPSDKCSIKIKLSMKHC